MAGLRWLLYGAKTDGFVHVNSRIVSIEGDLVTARVVSSSVYPAGSELTIQRRFLSGTEWHLGAKLIFTCRPEEISEMLKP